MCDLNEVKGMVDIMRVRYYDDFLAHKIAMLNKKNPYLAKQKYEDYLTQFPLDYSSWCSYIGLLITIHEFDLAEEKLNYIEEVILSDEKHLSDSKFMHLKLSAIFYCRIRLLNYTGRFVELFKMPGRIENKYFGMELGINKFLDVYCRKKLGKEIDVSRVDDSYLFHQIIDYSYDRMREHINEHSSDYNFLLETPESSVFSIDFPIDDILSEFKKCADSDKRLCFGLFDDTYFFKFDGCGRCKNKSTDYFKVVCFSDTLDIITMCPVESIYELPFIDMNYLSKNNMCSKVKCLSARDRFNRRYGLE